MSAYPDAVIKDKRRLIVVANRGPLRAEGTGAKRRWVRAAGGLVTALDPVLRARSGVWVSAQEQDDLTEIPVDDDALGYATTPVPLSRKIQQDFYQGVSNAILWPLLHSFPPTLRIGQAPWSSYVRANEAFAKAVIEASHADEVVWSHDYHLMLVPALLRAQRPASRIGWFCHVPWPSPDLFEILPWRSLILDGLLGSDLVGFHTDVYARNFLECVARLTPHAVDRDTGTVAHGGRTTRVIAAPIGVPVAEHEALARDEGVMREAQAIRDSVGGRSIVLGVDRLDYTKGIPERILAYERFLAASPDARGKHVYVQVMVPSRTDVQAYSALKEEIEALIGNVNGRYSRTGEVAIHYVYRNLDPRTLFAHYLAADVALVTPLRDGMNLVAHEYVVSRLDESGVLVLSELAGSARFLTDALLVNPYDIDAIAGALARAFEMDETAQRARMRSMRSAVKSLDVHRWADAFLEALESCAS